MSRATGASADGSSVPSWMRWSSALSRSADAAEPHGTSSRATYGRSMSPGVMGSTVSAPAVGGEVGAGDLEDAGVVGCGVERGDGVGPVLRDRLVAGEVLGVERAGPERGQVHHREDDHHPRDEQGADGHAFHLPALALPHGRERVHAHTEEHGQAERDQRDGAARAAQREAEARRLGERLEQPAEDRGVVVRVGADRDRDPDDGEHHEVGAVLPPHAHRREQGEDRDGEAHRQQSRGSGCTARCPRSSDRPGRCRRRTSTRGRGAPRSAATTATRPAASR